MEFKFKIKKIISIQKVLVQNIKEIMSKKIPKSYVILENFRLKMMSQHRCFLCLLWQVVSRSNRSKKFEANGLHHKTVNLLVCGGFSNTQFEKFVLRIESAFQRRGWWYFWDELSSKSHTLPGCFIQFSLSSSNGLWENCVVHNFLNLTWCGEPTEGVTN